MDLEETRRITDAAIARVRQEDLEMAYRHLLASINRPQKAIEYKPCDYCAGRVNEEEEQLRPDGS